MRAAIKSQDAAIHIREKLIDFAYLAGDMGDWFLMGLILMAVEELAVRAEGQLGDSLPGYIGSGDNLLWYDCSIANMGELV